MLAADLKRKHLAAPIEMAVTRATGLPLARQLRRILEIVGSIHRWTFSFRTPAAKENIFLYHPELSCSAPDKITRPSLIHPILGNPFGGREAMRSLLVRRSMQISVAS
jgi:hypothetical protein